MPARSKRHRPTVCRLCGEQASPTRAISFRGLCRPCAIDEQTKSAVDQVAKSGPYYDSWRRSMLAVAADLDDAER